MSRRLVLIRHAKTARSHPQGDHERELVEQGERDAAALAEWLDEEGLAPDLVLVSTAVRARQTLSALLGEGAEQMETWPTRRIYDGGVDGLLEAISEADDTAETVWLVGHEPTISTAAWELIDKDSPDSARNPGDVAGQLAHGIPTSTAIVLELDDPWSEVAPGTASFRAAHIGRG